MRKFLFILLFVPALLCAQPAQFGFFSLKAVMEELPEYTEAQNNYNSLLELCDAEVASGEEVLTRAYVSFLDGQSTFPEPILRKRQKELQDLVDRNVALRDQLKVWLEQAHDSLFAPILLNVDMAVERVCLHKELAYAIDTDKEAYRYVNPNFGVDITELVIKEVVSPGTLQAEEGEKLFTGDEPAAEEEQSIEEAVAEESQSAAEEPVQEIVNEELQPVTEEDAATEEAHTAAEEKETEKPVKVDVIFYDNETESPSAAE